MKWYLIVVLVCMPLTIGDVQHLFTYPLAVCVFSLENVYSSPLPIFKLDYLWLPSGQSGWGATLRVGGAKTQLSFAQVK